MDQSLTRGAAVAVFALGSLTAFGPAHAQVAAGAVRPVRDSMVVRMINTDQKALVDSVTVIMRALDGEAPLSEQAFRLRRRMDEIMATLVMSGRGRATGNYMFRTGPEQAMREMEARFVKGWIGINTGGAPHETFADSSGYFVRYFKYPEIISVEPNSPAQRAGIIPGDVLVAYDGNDVVGRRLDISQLLVPDRRLGVTVQREGESKEFSLVVAKTPQRIFLRRADAPPLPPGGTFTMAVPGHADQPRVLILGETGPVGSGEIRAVGPAFSITRNGVFGAQLTTLSPELARAWNKKEGVFIDQCPEGTPAYLNGLRTGDAIIAVAGQNVTRAQDVQALVYSKLAEKAVVFRVLRDNKPVNVTVKW